MSRRIFVFGSNLAGIHGAGSAKEAYEKHGAVWGCGFGLSGNSFAIPTKDHNLQTLPLDAIDHFFGAFATFARNPWVKDRGWKFDLVDIGCGLAGYTPQEVFDNIIEGHYLLHENVNFLGALGPLYSAWHEECSTEVSDEEYPLDY
jgi:hypothetical protein